VLRVSLKTTPSDDALTRTAVAFLLGGAAPLAGEIKGDIQSESAPYQYDEVIWGIVKLMLVPIPKMKLPFVIGDQRCTLTVYNVSQEPGAIWRGIWMTQCVIGGGAPGAVYVVATRQPDEPWKFLEFEGAPAAFLLEPTEKIVNFL